MKRKIGIIFTLAFAAMAVFIMTSPNGQASTENPADELKITAACPTGMVTIQGCITEDDGCFICHTINGRDIYVNLTPVSVGAGDVASLTGQFVTDHDCDPCVLAVTSATDLGDC